jgi:ABC-2 type transport system ATP-binding protein
MGEPLAIMATGLTKRFKDVTAVNNLSLNIHRGEIYGFLGLNGAGKTTTIRMLLGMIQPSAGSASLFGTKVQPGEHSIWRRVGYLVETPHAYPDLTVRENLEIVRRLRKLNDAGTVEKIMEELELTHYASRRARTLSLGNAQRLGLAKALIHHPDLLVLDEPANGLDPAGVVEIRELLAGLARQQGVTVFMSSHILTEVDRLATRIGIIHQGRLLEELEAHQLEELRRQRLEIQTRDLETAKTTLANAGFEVKVIDHTIHLGEARAVNEPDGVATLLVKAGAAPTRLAVAQEDLEDYFLRLTGAIE